MSNLHVLQLHHSGKIAPFVQKEGDPNILPTLKQTESLEPVVQAMLIAEVGRREKAQAVRAGCANRDNNVMAFQTGF